MRHVSLFFSGLPSFPELYNMLLPYGLNVSAVMLIHAALKAQQDTVMT